MRKAIALAAATLASITIAPAAMAQCSEDGWCFIVKTDSSTTYQRFISSNERYATVDLKTHALPMSRGESIVTRRIYDCQATRWRYSHEQPSGVSREQTWKDFTPGTHGMYMFRKACEPCNRPAAWQEKNGIAFCECVGGRNCRIFYGPR